MGVNTVRVVFTDNRQFRVFVQVSQNAHDVGHALDINCHGGDVVLGNVGRYCSFLYFDLQIESFTLSLVYGLLDFDKAVQKLLSSGGLIRCSGRHIRIPFDLDNTLGRNTGLRL
jgi:hypothetical protein